MLFQCVYCMCVYVVRVCACVCTHVHACVLCARACVLGGAHVCVCVLGGAHMCIVCACMHACVSVLYMYFYQIYMYIVLRAWLRAYLQDESSTKPLVANQQHNIRVHSDPLTQKLSPPPPPPTTIRTRASNKLTRWAIHDPTITNQQHILAPMLSKSVERVLHLHHGLDDVLLELKGCNNHKGREL